MLSAIAARLLSITGPGADLKLRQLRTVLVVMVLTLTPLPTAVAQTDAAKPAVGTFAPDRIVVGFRPEATTAQRQDVRNRLGATLRERIAQLDVDVLRLPAGVDPVAASQALASLTGVRFAEPDFLAEPFVEPVGTVPNDPKFNLQYGLDNTVQGTPDADIDAPQAWLANSGSANVGVAVIDTGLESSHEDLAPNFRTRLFQGNCPFSSTSCKHATHVAGIAGAKGNNGLGVSGVNWTVSLIDVPFDFSSTGTATAIRMVSDYAVANSMKIVMNASFGGSGSCPSVVANALEYAKTRGLLFVAAAGNDGYSIDSRSEWPGGCPQANVVTVASTDKYDALSSFSNYGTLNVDIAAPGSSIASTYPGNTYAYMSGTSMASPMVAGAAALLWAAAPTLDYASVKNALMGSVDPKSALATKVGSGGRLNVWKALQQVAPASFPDPSIPPSGDPTPTPSPTPIISTTPSPTPVPTPAPEWTTVQDSSSGVTFSGSWSRSSSSLSSGGSYRRSRTTGGSATLNFTGTNIRWIGVNTRYAGITNVYIDNNLVANVDGYASSTRYQRVLFERLGLSDGPHTIRLEVSGNLNPSARYGYTYLDAFAYGSVSSAPVSQTSGPTPAATTAPTVTASPSPTGAPTATPAPTAAPTKAP